MIVLHMSNIVKQEKGSEHMARTVGIGTQSFETVREKNTFYVDKTSFIKEWWENQDDVTFSLPVVGVHQLKKCKKKLVFKES